MNSALGTCGSIIKDVTFVSLEFWKEQKIRAELEKYSKKKKTKKNHTHKKPKQLQIPQIWQET